MINNRKKCRLSRVLLNLGFKISYYSICNHLFGYGMNGYYLFNQSKKIRRIW